MPTTMFPARRAARFLWPCLLLAGTTLAAAPRESVRAADLEGEIELRFADYPDHAVTQPYLKTGWGAVELAIEDGAANLRSGDRIRVSGAQAGGPALVAGTGSVTTLVTAPAALTLGAQYTLVMLVNFTDNTSQPWSAADARTRFFTDASNFYLESSYGQTWLAGDVVGWYALPLSATCNVTDIASAARQAAGAAGVNLAAYSHYVYAYPANAACGWSGQGSIGGNPSELFINGDLSLHTVVHELGHNFGLFHSHALDCGASVIGSSCSVAEYGDRLDAMGIQGTSHFNAFQKERLGWLNYGAAPAITTVQASGSYAIDPYETAGGTKALKILKSTDATTGAKTWYYIEYRQALGFDSALASMPYANFQNGVIVHLGTDGDGRSSDILNMTPQSSLADWNDVALVAGQSFTDSAAGVAFATSWADATSAGVTVTLTDPAPAPAVCTSANPAVALSGSTQSVGAGSTLSYTFTLTNHDSSACPTSTFNLSRTVPSGWSGLLAATTLTVAPGATATTTLSVTSPTTAKAGNYTVGVTATNGSVSATATAVYSVASPKGGKRK